MLLPEPRSESSSRNLSHNLSLTYPNMKAQISTTTDSSQLCPTGWELLLNTSDPKVKLLDSLVHCPYLDPQNDHKPAYPKLVLSDVIEEKPTSKGQARASLTACSDTEFRSEGNQQNRMITTQLQIDCAKVKDKAYIFEHPSNSQTESPTSNSQTESPHKSNSPGHVPAWGDSRFLLSELFDVTEKECPKYGRFKADVELTIRVAMFFSASDVLRGLFSDSEDRDYIARHLTQTPVLKVEVGGNQYKASALPMLFY
jgi:hypothetical protein